MPLCDTLIRNVRVLDGSGAESETADVAIDAGVICAIGQLSQYGARQVTEGEGRVLSPGFIDVHTHDDTNVIRDPQMMAKLSQGVTTVIVGNCGISAAPVRLAGAPPDPMNLLGEADAFRYPTFAAYVAAVDAAQPAVNVAALAGHTALRNNHMDRLDRAATAAEIQAMRAQLTEALDHGALGLSSGLAYGSARSAPPEEILALAEPLAAAGAIYATHMRTEAEEILGAMREAFATGRECHVPVVISHLKCAGIGKLGQERRSSSCVGHRTGRTTCAMRLLSLYRLLQHSRSTARWMSTSASSLPGRRHILRWPGRHWSRSPKPGE